MQLAVKNIIIKQEKKSMMLSLVDQWQESGMSQSVEQKY